MLLRRVANHLKDQNWTAVVLDFAIVVIGVFIGIQVSNWNTGRLEQRRASEVIQALIADLVDIEDVTEKQMANLADRVLVTKRIVDLLSSDVAAPANGEQLQQDLENATTFLSAILRSPTIIELISSGQTELISDRDLRTEVIRFDQTVQAGLSIRERLVDLGLTHVAYLSSRTDPMYEFSGDGRELIRTRYRIDLSELRADPSFVPSLKEINATHLEEITWRSAVHDRAAELRGHLEAFAATVPDE